MKPLTSILFTSLVVTGCAENPVPEPSCATTVCDPNATCSDASGEPTCTCNAGFTGDGMECTPNQPALLPETCADLLVTNPNATDGTYTLYWSNDQTKAWTAYCANMASQPTAYLPLVHTGGDSNFSQYTAGGDSPGSNVRTSYTRLQIDEHWLTVDIGDQTFSTSTGQLDDYYVVTVTSMPFAEAMSCDGTASGRGNVDLTGTPFKATAGDFAVGGNSASGGATMQDTAGQVWNITGGGDCGFVAPPGGSLVPVNNHAGFSFQLYFQ